MESWEKARHVARLTADKVKITARGQTFFIKSPSRFQRVLAEDLYYQTLEEADDAYSEDELLFILEAQGVWSAEDDEKLKRVQTDIENLKIKYI